MRYVSWCAGSGLVSGCGIRHRACPAQSLSLRQVPLSPCLCCLSSSSQFCVQKSNTTFPPSPTRTSSSSSVIGRNHSPGSGHRRSACPARPGASATQSPTLAPCCFSPRLPLQSYGQVALACGMPHFLLPSSLPLPPQFSLQGLPQPQGGHYNPQCTRALTPHCLRGRALWVPRLVLALNPPAPHAQPFRLFLSYCTSPASLHPELQVSAHQHPRPCSAPARPRHTALE